MKLRIDPDVLTLGDLEDFESAAGVDLLATLGRIDAASGMAGLGIKTVVALVWICMRSDQPDFTLDDARKVRLAEIEVEVGEPDPTSGGD